MRKQSIVLLLAAILIVGYFWHTGTPEQREQPSTDRSGTTAPVEALTKETIVVPYLKKNGRLPAYYITKQEARQKGWIAAQGNLCEVLPGRAIGGDFFSNREKTLPVKSGRKWYEADINYHCGHRNADRLLFSNDGLVFVTKDHYRSFEEK
ncbi:ribonuclease domain-containing protein [Niabella hirudinis]|uniref:ribonuclease domain-containing protein n=1 Tax=Niabella hirudinis TaxID=1285929 RepID=UPI003EC0794E